MLLGFGFPKGTKHGVLRNRSLRVVPRTIARSVSWHDCLLYSREALVRHLLVHTEGQRYTEEPGPCETTRKGERSSLLAWEVSAYILL